MKVSAFVLCHKLEQFVDRAIGSLVTQSRLPDKIYLVGTDCRQETYNSFKHWESHRTKPQIIMSREKMTCHQSKNFCSRCRNPGDTDSDITESFFVLDADDWLMPKFVERCLGFLEGSDVAAVGCDYQVVDHHGVLTKAVTNDLRIGDIAKGNPMPAVSIVRRSAFEECGPYREDFVFEDWALWVDMLAKGYRLFRYPQILFNHYRHETNITNSTNNSKGYEQIQCLLSSTTAKPLAPKS